MTQATAKLKWHQAGTRMWASQDSFMPLLETVLANMERCYSDELQQQYTPHPDGATVPLLKRVGNALFVQGWLPYVEEGTAKLLLEKTGLVQEYLKVENIDATELTCGHCKNQMPVFAGAKQCVCEQCTG